MKVAIYNDCDVNSYKHFGCELVMETFKDQLSRVDCELVGTVKKDNFRDAAHVKSILDKSDLVIVNGEGSLHHDRRNDLLAIGKNWNSILINTVFEKNVTSGLENFKYISCRESYSARAAKEASGLDIDTIPDIIFTNKRINSLKLSGKKKHVIINHFRSGEISTNNNANDFLKEVIEYESISSISFHSLIIAMILGQKIIKIIPTTTHKNSGLLHDYKADENYVSNAKRKINTMFENIHSWV